MAENEKFSANKILAFSYLLAEKISCSAEHEKSFISSGPVILSLFMNSNVRILLTHLGPWLNAVLFSNKSK